MEPDRIYYNLTLNQKRHSLKCPFNLYLSRTDYTFEQHCFFIIFLMFSEHQLKQKKDWQSSIREINQSENCQSFFFWSQKLHKWTSEEHFLEKKSFIQDSEVLRNYLNEKTNFINNELASVTLNVLFDFRSSEQPDKDRGHMKFSHQRYVAILAQLQKMGCDIITLNEVTRPFVKMIEETDWVRKNYKISTLHNSSKSIQCFGNIILTKLNPLGLHLLKVPNLPRVVPIGFFLVQKKINGQNKQKDTKRSIVTFSSIHLTAYDVNQSRRQKQLKATKEYLNQLNGFVDQHILQGDMNFHSEKQNAIAQNNQLSDSWLTVHKINEQKDMNLNPGYTFDAITNFFTKELYWGFEKRRMRLDRIFYTTQQKHCLTPVEIKVVFNQPIYEQEAQEPNYNILKSSVSFLADKMNWNLFRNKQKYLFCSDHFGLLCKFQIQN